MRISGFGKNEIEIFKRELRQLPFLEKELKMWREELEKKSYESVLQSPKWNGVKVTDTSDRTADIALTVATTKEIVEKLVFRIEKQKNKLMRFINSIDDSLYRQILFYRNVQGLEWNEVANHIGGDNSDVSVKKMYSRIFERPYNFHILTEDALLQ